MKSLMPYYRVMDRTPAGPDPDAFIMTFALGASDSITLPLVNGGTYNFTVNWGDGTSNVITAWNQTERVHSYSGQPAGDYVVTITGTCTVFSFLSVSTSRPKLKNILQYGNPGFTTLSFFGCTNLISIPAESIKYYGTSIESIFWGCTGVTSVPIETFSHYSMNSVTNASGILNGTRITSIPSGLLDQFTSATLFNLSFGANPSLVTVPSGLFSNCTAITTLENCFQNDTGITSIPANLLDNCTNLQNVAGFLRNTRITSIPIDFFRYNTLITTFNNTFNATRFTSIPTDIFRYNTSVTTFQECFINNPSLTTLPTDVFRYNTLATNFQSLLFGCTAFTSVPTDIFRYNTLATNLSFVFYNTRITSIPIDIFRYNTSVTSFAGTFSQNPSLTSVPVDLFRYNTSVTAFGTNQTSQGVFSSCTNLSTIPSDLFNYNVNVTNYFGAFFNNISLSVSVSSLVSGMTMTACTTTNQMFSGCTALTGNGQDLIDKPKAAGYTVGTATNTGSYRTFFNCTALTDFATIPAEYK